MTMDLSQAYTESQFIYFKTTGKRFKVELTRCKEPVASYSIGPSAILVFISQICSKVIKYL